MDTKVVINTKYGGFSLSRQAVRLYAQLAGITLVEVDAGYDNESIYYRNSVTEENFFHPESDLDRTDPKLVQVVEMLGHKADGRYAKLKIVNIPSDVEWYISDNDGRECVVEVSRMWG